MQIEKRPYLKLNGRVGWINIASPIAQPTTNSYEELLHRMGIWFNITAYTQFRLISAVICIVNRQN